MNAERPALAAAIFVATLLLVMTRPRRLSEAVSALGGALAMLAIGAVGPAEAVNLLLGSWNVFLFFLGLMLVSAFAEQAGLFDWLALTAARAAAGSGQRLLLGIAALGVLLTAFLSNDATALILTPVVYALVTRLGLSARPYVYTCTFIADTASFLLPVSNPINVLVLDAFPLPLGVYLARLFPAALAAIAVNLAVFFWLFRDELRPGYDLSLLGPAAAAIPDRGFFRFSVGCLLLLAVAYLFASSQQWPLAPVALAAALTLLLGAARFGRLQPERLAREVSWTLFPFVAGLFVLVKGIENTGLVDSLGQLLLILAGDAAWQAALAAVFGAALLANLVNNVPAALVLIAALQKLADSPLRDRLVAGALVGADLGPNLTTVGSLATMLWLLLLRRRGLEVSSLEYVRIGALTTPPMLLAAVLMLWLTGGR